jgi:glycine cleavage system regulatory protein
VTIPIVLTFIGHDRPGLVSAISEKVAASGGTWLESRLAHLAGEFAGILLISIPEPNITGLTASLRDLEAAGVRVAVERSSGSPTPKNLKTVRLELVGNERPGIVRDVTQALTRLGVNIEEFSSNIEARHFREKKCSAPRRCFAPPRILPTITSRKLWSGSRRRSWSI